MFTSGRAFEGRGGYTDPGEGAFVIKAVGGKQRRIPTMVCPMNKFHEAQAGFETKDGKYMKAVINPEREDGELYRAE